MLAAVGVVYGDIGTSPLYALKEVFAHGHVSLTPVNIYGVLSLVFWTLTVVVSIKYVVLILRADNNGEGGLIAMLALASTAVKGRPVLRRRLLFLGIFGTAIFFGDGVITPAISVLSAVEGLEVAAPALHKYIIPVTLVVLTALFMVQRHGTSNVGKLFGPVMVLWFGVLAVLGLQHIVENPAILWALSPHYALVFLLGNPAVAFIALGSVVLCVTGAEALYADMGHFGKRPIRLAWFSLAMPALVLNYFGQGAMLLEHPGRVRNPFFEMAPTWALYPLIALATCATVIASQALITAAFSVTKQAIQLGYLPRLRILHTSVREAGQVYVPFINWSLYVCIVIAVVIFGSTTKLAAAYGIAVTIDMLITTTMTFFVIRYGWKYPWSLCFAATGFFFIVDFVYFSANVVKVFDGGWFPVAIGGVMFTLMMTWKQGRKLMKVRMREDAIDLKSFLEAVFVSPPTRVQGTAVFLVSDQGITPNALLHNLKHNKVLHERNVLLTVETLETPIAEYNERTEITALGGEFYRLTLRFGFAEDQDIPVALARCETKGLDFDMMDTTFFISRETVVATDRPGMPLWRDKLFAFLARNSNPATAFFRIPGNRLIELGTQVEI